MGTQVARAPKCISEYGIVPTRLGVRWTEVARRNFAHLKRHRVGLDSDLVDDLRSGPRDVADLRGVFNNVDLTGIDFTGGEVEGIQRQLNAFLGQQPSHHTGGRTNDFVFRRYEVGDPGARMGLRAILVGRCVLSDY